MENIDPIIGKIPQASFQIPQDAALKQSVSVVFKEILNSLIKTDEADDAFKSDEDKELSSGFTSEFEGYLDQVVDSFTNSPEGQQILNQIYKQYSLSTDIKD